MIVVPIMFLIFALVFIHRVPCGEVTEEGGLWDGECMYGFLLMDNLQYKVSQANERYKQCAVKEFELTFTCPLQTTIQYWPNIFNSDFVTITQKSIVTPQTTDELFYKEGFVLIRSALDPKYPSDISAAEYLQKEAAAEKARIASGKLPLAPGPYILLPQVINIVPKWTGAVTAHTGTGDVVYMAVRNGYIYEVRRNSTQGFSDQKVTRMLSTLSWSQP